MNKPAWALRALSSLCVLVALGFCAASCGASTSHTHPLLGFAAPETHAELLGGDGPKTVAEARGKVVIVDFFATYCEPCKKTFPAYQHIADEYPGDVAVIAVAVDEPDTVTKEQILDFGKKHGARFPILWDKDGSIRRRYVPPALPSAFILDRSGTLRHLHVSYAPGYELGLSSEVKALLGEPAGAAGRLAGLPALPFKPLSCEGPKQSPQGDEHLAAMRRKCPNEKCRKAHDELVACAGCLVSSCCAEMAACEREAFEPESAARADASRCQCLLASRIRKQSRSYGETHCGPTNDLYGALSACIAAHCADVCPEKQGGPPP